MRANGISPGAIKGYYLGNRILYFDMITKVQISDRTFEYAPLFLLILLVMLAVPLVMMDRYNAAIMLLALPLLLVTAISPRLLLYLYVMTMTVDIYPVPGMTLLIADYVLIGLVMASVIDFLVKIGRSVAIPRLTVNYLLLIGVMVIAGLAAYSPVHSITPVIRATLQLTVLVLFFNHISRDDIEKLPQLFFWIMVGQAAIMTLSFITLGGTSRVFGVAGKYTDDLMMLAFAVGLAYAVWAPSSARARFYGFGTIMLLAGLLSTQSRFPVFTVVWVGLALLIFSWYYAGKIGIYPARRRVRTAFIAATVFIMLILAGMTIFSGIVRRFDYALSKNMGSSVLMRFSLWKTAILTFLENPWLGIGPGNFRIVDAAVPSVKFVVIRHLVRGLSAHNMVLHYLAETGILGATALVWLYGRYFKMAFDRARAKMSEFPVAIRMALFGVALTAFGEIFYMDGWMWGLTAFPIPFFMALTCRMVKEENVD